MAKRPPTPAENPTVNQNASNDAQRGYPSTNLAYELKKFRVLYELAIAMTSENTLKQNLQLAVDQSRHLLEADTAYIALRDETRGDVYMHTLSGIRTEAFKAMRLPYGKGLGGLVAKTRKGYIIDDYLASKTLDHVVDQIVANEGVISGMAVPIQMGPENLGVLYVFNRRATQFSQAALDTLALIGNLVALEITRKRAGSALQRAHAHMEQLVSERTAKLTQANLELKQEIEERQRVTDALQESEARYKTLTNNLNIGVYRNTVGPTGRFIEANPALIKMFGYASRDEILKIRVSDLYQDPKDREILSDKLIEAGLLRSEELKLRRKDGSTFIGAVSAVAMKDEDGRVKYYDGIIEDVSQRKAAELALKESEEKYRQLVENAQDAIFVTQDEVIKFMNPTAKRFLGYSSDVLYKTPFVKFIHPEDREAMRHRYIRRLQGEAVSPSVSFRVINKNGEERFVDLNAVLITWEGRSAILNFLRDITPQKTMEAQLQQVQKMEAIGTLAGGIAHNFNNMLMGIQGNLSLVRLELEQGSVALQKIEKIEEIVESASKMTSQLLGYAREGRYEVETLDLNRLIEDSSDIFKLTRKDIKIECHLEEELKGLRGDKSQIEQVLWNLYVNASDAMPQGGAISIKTRNISSQQLSDRPFKIKAGEYLSLMIADQGVGMDEKTREQIFEPFFTTKEVGKGTGLGLASVYGIVKAHGGYIEVESTPGQGAKFYIYLPASKRALATASTGDEALTPGIETLLLVDDEEMIIEVGQQLLERLGYQVIVARSGQEAIQLFSTQHAKIALVILDMVMPNMSGGETYDRLKAIDPTVKVLLSSGYALEGQAAAILDRGCNGFIQKPFKLEHISKKIREIIGDLE